MLCKLSMFKLYNDVCVAMCHPTVDGYVLFVCSLLLITRETEKRRITTRSRNAQFPRAMHLRERYYLGREGRSRLGDGNFGVGSGGRILDWMENWSIPVFWNRTKVPGDITIATTTPNRPRDLGFGTLAFCFFATSPVSRHTRIFTSV